MVRGEAGGSRRGTLGLALGPGPAALSALHRACSIPSVAIHALLLLSAALAAPATADEPTAAAAKLLGSCKRSATSAGVRFACDGFAASVGEYPGLSPEEVLRIHAASLKALGEVSSQPAEFSSGGKPWSAIRFAVRRPDGSVAFEGRAAARELRARTVRLVSCGGADAGPRSPCGAVLALLAETGPAPYAVPKSAPSFLGRKVPVPSGCEVLDASETGFRIRCGDVAALTFLQLQAPEHIEKLSATVVDQLHQSVPGVKDGKPRPCRIGGVPTSCKVVIAGSGAGGSAFYIGGAVVHGVPVTVQCLQHAIVKGVHPVCASVITF